MSGIFDPTMVMVGHGLDLTLTRQTAINANLANLDTPGYTPNDVNFAEALQEAMQTGEIGEDALMERPDKAPGVDGNSVDLDMQLARVSQNATLYQASSKVMSRKLAMLRYVISEGA
jgi:flagellar basal-body rod protein FlgB